MASAVPKEKIYSSLALAAEVNRDEPQSKFRDTNRFPDPHEFATTDALECTVEERPFQGRLPASPSRSPLGPVVVFALEPRTPGLKPRVVFGSSAALKRRSST